MESTTNAKKLILTEEEVSHIRDLIEELRASLYKTDFKLEEHINKNFTELQKEFLLLEVKIGSSVSDLEKSIDKVLKNLSSMESILIKVPFEPTVSFITWVKEFLSEKVGNVDLVIKLQTDHTIMVGALLEFKGKIKKTNFKNEIINILTNSAAPVTSTAANNK